MTVLGSNRRRMFQALASALLAVVGFGGCRRSPAAPPVPQQAAKPMVQQPVQTRVESDREKSCREFVQGFYDWYIAKETSSEGSNSTYNVVLQFNPNVLSSKLRGMLIEEYATDAKMNGDLDLQLDFDPYVNSQDDTGHLAVRNAIYREGKCRASVWLTEPGAERNMVDPELALQNGKWVFINFHYPDPDTPSDENLRDMLIQLRKDRNRAFKQGAQP